MQDSDPVSERRAGRGARLHRGTFRDGTFRAEGLNARWLASGTETRQVGETWRKEYQESRPHRARGERTPNEFAKEIAARRDFLGSQIAENSPWKWHQIPGPINQRSNPTGSGS